MSETIDELCTNTIRLMAVDAIARAKSDVPGARPLGAALIFRDPWSSRAVGAEVSECLSPLRKVPSG